MFSEADRTTSASSPSGRACEIFNFRFECDGQLSAAIVHACPQRALLKVFLSPLGPPRRAFDARVGHMVGGRKRWGIAGVRLMFVVALRFAGITI